MTSIRGFVVNVEVTIPLVELQSLLTTTQVVWVSIAEHIALALRSHDTPICGDLRDVAAVALFTVFESTSRISVIRTPLETGLDGIIDSVDYLVGEDTRGARFTE